jgi:proteasome activator subunit 4
LAHNLSQSEDLLEKHAGVLALSAVILAYPYTVPDFIPDVLMNFCRFASDKQPIHVRFKARLTLVYSRF